MLSATILLSTLKVKFLLSYTYLEDLLHTMGNQTRIILHMRLYQLTIHSSSNKNSPRVQSFFFIFYQNSLLNLWSSTEVKQEAGRGQIYTVFTLNTGAF